MKVDAPSMFYFFFYLQDSHICRAAVHAGVISDALGGRVKVKRETGVSLYHGSTANNVSATT